MPRRRDCGARGNLFDQKTARRDGAYRQSCPLSSDRTSRISSSCSRRRCSTGCRRSTSSGSSPRAVDQLNLDAIVDVYRESGQGNLPYHPAMMLKLRAHEAGGEAAAEGDPCVDEPGLPTRRLGGRAVRPGLPRRRGGLRNCSGARSVWRRSWRRRSAWRRGRRKKPPPGSGTATKMILRSAAASGTSSASTSPNRRSAG